MNTPPHSDSRTRSDNAPTLSLWLGAHLAFIAVGALLALALRKDTQVWLTTFGPLGLGIAQATALHRRLPIWALILWPLATACGFVSSMILGWFTYFGFGFFSGVFQTGLLAAGRFRFFWLWPWISGGVWLLAFLGYLAIIEGSKLSLSVSAGLLGGLVFSMTLLVYALLTGLALRWMDRRTAPAPCAATDTIG